MATFSTDDIEHAVGEAAYLRGLDYLRRGMVRSAAFGPHGRIHGEVSGSRPRPYAVAVRYESRDNGRLVPVDGHCSCPVGRNCKHMAAVLLAARHLSPEAADGGTGNPATERQAMDRAHRIGQDKPVFVHRLIAENTVEAAIQRMQARKQALADALFEGAARGPLGLTDADIEALFGPAQSGSPDGRNGV